MSGVVDEVYSFTKRKLKWLESVSSGNNKAILAELRKGTGKKPGDDPKLWGILFDEMPSCLMSKNGDPTAAEWAVYTSITIYAIHQQGKDVKNDNMNVDGIGLGHAVANLVKVEEDRERIERHFFTLASASEMKGVSHYLREIVQLLKAENIGLDYALLSKELYLFQKSDLAPKVRLRWGQDFYSELNKRMMEDDKND